MTESGEAPAIRDQILAELDAVLGRQIEAERKHQEARRAESATLTALNKIESEARGLRLALFALDGVDGSSGLANVENSKRSMELRRRA